MSPPKTTIPKTLAALPRSQYATALELVSGKNAFFSGCSNRIVRLNEDNGDMVDALRAPRADVLRLLEALVDFVKDEGNCFCDIGRERNRRGAQHVKNCLDSRGAACRKRGND